MISTNQGFSSTFPIPLTRPHTAFYLFILLEASGKCSNSGCHKHALEHLEAARSGKKWIFLLLATVNAWLLLTFLKACGWPGHIFGASASLRFLTKKSGCVTLFHCCSWRSALYQIYGIRIAIACSIHSWLTIVGAICLNQLV